jgi:hypothetical protein
MTIPLGFDWRTSGTLLANERACRRLPCGCVPIDPKRRCPKAEALKDCIALERRLFYGSKQYDAAFKRLADHLNGESA